jgi:Phage integrase family
MLAAVASAVLTGAAGAPWIGFHSFLHTCATMLCRRGWKAVQVQRFLGHSDPGFTQRTYVHLLDEDLPEPDFSADVRSTSGELERRRELGSEDVREDVAEQALADLRETFAEAL